MTNSFIDSMSGFVFFIGIPVTVKKFKEVQQYEYYSVRCKIRTNTIRRFVTASALAMIPEETSTAFMTLRQAV